MNGLIRENTGATQSHSSPSCPELGSAAAAPNSPAADCWVDGPAARLLLQRLSPLTRRFRARSGRPGCRRCRHHGRHRLERFRRSRSSPSAKPCSLASRLPQGFCAIAEFYQQLDLFCDSPENARCLSSILDEPRTLEGSIAYRALAVQGKAASDELTARSRDMKEYRNYIELWVHETKTPIASAQLALASLHGPEIGKVRGDLDRIESRVEQALYYARSATLSEDFSIEELHLAALARKACRQRSRTLIGAGVSLEFAIDETLEVLADAKWTDFIIGQVLENSAKYGAKTIRFEGTAKDAGHERRLHRAADRRRRRRHPRCRCAARVRPRLHGKPGPHASQGNGHGAAPSRRCLRKNGPWPAHFLRRWDGHHRRADLPPRPHAHGSGGILAGAHCKPRSARALPVGAYGDEPYNIVSLR